MQTIKGRAFHFGNNIDTDQIYPGRYLDKSDHAEIAEHVMEGADPTFKKKYRPGDVVIAGTNFGTGSSREHAVITLKAAGVGAIIAESFARIFYRNAVNTALPVLICPGITGKLSEEEEITVDFVNATITRSSGEVLQAEKLSDYVLNIYKHGGVIEMYKAKAAGQE